MKKTISLILTLVMLFSMGTITMASAPAISIDSCFVNVSGTTHTIEVSYTATGIAKGEPITAFAYANSYSDDSVQSYEGTAKIVDMEQVAYDADNSKITLQIPASEVSEGEYVMLRLGGWNISTAAVEAVKIRQSVDVGAANAELLENLGKLPSEPTRADVVTLLAIRDLIADLTEEGVTMEEIESYPNYDRYKKVLGEMYNVVSAEAEYVNSDITITVEFDKDIAVSEITEDTLSVTRGGDEIEWTATKGETNKIIISANNSGSKYENLRVHLTPGLVCNYSKLFEIPIDIERSDIVIKNSATEKVYSIEEITDGTVNISYDVTNNTYTNAKEVWIYTAIYKNNRLLDVKMSGVTLSKGVTANISAPFTGLGDLADAEIHTFVLGEGTLSPLVEKASYKKTYGLDNILDTTKDIKVGFIGGSITEGKKYSVPFIASWQEERTGDIIVNNKGVGGTGTDFGSVRLKDDLLSQNPDIVFVEFTLNDLDAKIKPTCGVNVESIIRQCQAMQHEPVLVFIHIPDRRGTTAYNIQENINTYDAVLSYYGLTAINAHQMVVDATGCVTPPDNTGNTASAWDAYVSYNDVHPNTTQGQNIAELMYNEFEANSTSYLKKIGVKDATYNTGVPEYENPSMIDSTYASYDSNWRKWGEGTEFPIKSEGYGAATSARFANFMATDVDGAKMSFEFTGSGIVINGHTSYMGRYATYTITNDEGEIVKSGDCNNIVSTKTHYYENIVCRATGLPYDTYTIEITVGGIKTDYETEYPRLFGIGEFFVDEK